MRLGADSRPAVAACSLRVAAHNWTAANIRGPGAESAGVVVHAGVDEEEAEGLDVLRVAAGAAELASMRRMVPARRQSEHRIRSSIARLKRRALEASSAPTVQGEANAPPGAPTEQCRRMATQGEAHVLHFESEVAVRSIAGGILGTTQVASESRKM